MIDIGRLPVALRTTEPGFAQLLERHYVAFLNPQACPVFDFEVSLVPPGILAGDEDVRVWQRSAWWLVERGDFRAGWDRTTRRGWIQQSVNPYATDSFLRILHTLLLSEEDGFLVHAASAVRRGRAFLFAGPSGAGKSTIARLAPPDATLLSDEVSYVRRQEGGYRAYGTPFAGELARLGENLVAPLSALYVLEKGGATVIEPLRPADAVEAIMQNILFFTKEAKLAEGVFSSACDFVNRVPVYRLSFSPEPAVWEDIG